MTKRARTPRDSPILLSDDESVEIVECVSANDGVCGVDAVTGFRDARGMFR
jgi:hypothetical protein